ncbi:TPA: aminopeptidase P family protein [Candidatus Bipolaricaulota bacterium]|nr:aminopeptidase P family protein [Candidatus Bipolaricaulota bacterium]HIP99573.1 aminopeptidase P family protein [Candidatus Bipolaricaulota bacterium]
MDHAARRAKLRRRLAEEGLDAFLVINLEGSDGANLRYLTGFTGSAGGLIVGKEGDVFATDSRYTERAAREVPDLPIEKLPGRWLDWLADRLESLSLKRVGIGAQRTSLWLYRELEKRLKGVELVPLEGWVEGLRRVKDPEEVERIAAAARLTDEGLRWLLGRLKPGTSEREAALELEMWYRKNGADHVAFDLIVAFGEGSSMPHYLPGERELKEGDLILLDIGAKVDGYCADLTRVVALGRPAPEARAIYELVLEANRAGLEAVRAGVTGVEADRAARKLIQEAGYGDQFGHGLGHGVGLEVHEGPRLSPVSEDTLEAGMVVTVEPGVYLPGKLGVRIEDLVVVRPDGCEILSAFPKEELLVL